MDESSVTNDIKPNKLWQPVDSKKKTDKKKGVEASHLVFNQPPSENLVDVRRTNEFAKHFNICIGREESSRSQPNRNVLEQVDTSSRNQFDDFSLIDQRFRTLSLSPCR